MKHLPLQLLHCHNSILSAKRDFIDSMVVRNCIRHRLPQDLQKPSSAHLFLMASKGCCKTGRSKVALNTVYDPRMRTYQQNQRYINIYIHVYVCVYIYMCMYIWRIRLYVSVHVYVYVMYVSTCQYVHAVVYTHACRYIYTCVFQALGCELCA